MKFSTWRVPKTVVRDTETAFRRGLHEVFAIWTSPLSPASDVCDVRRCIIPEQHPGATPQGVFVHIAGAELSRIQVDNFTRQERSSIQLHTHPTGDVRMSQLDRQWEVVKHEGALSIIVPSYCRQSLDRFRGVNVYEREGSDWRLWEANEIAARLVIE